MISALESCPISLLVMLSVCTRGFCFPPFLHSTLVLSSCCLFVPSFFSFFVLSVLFSLFLLLFFLYNYFLFIYICLLLMYHVRGDPKYKQFQPDTEVFTGIVKRYFKVTNTQRNTTLRNRRVFRILHRVSHKSGLIGTSTSEANGKIDVPLVARTGWYDAAHCITHV
jgi:hypothetical protein